LGAGLGEDQRESIGTAGKTRDSNYKCIKFQVRGAELVIVCFWSYCM